MTEDASTVYDLVPFEGGARTVRNEFLQHVVTGLSSGIPYEFRYCGLASFFAISSFVGSRFAAVNELGVGPWSEPSTAVACPQLGDNDPLNKSLLNMTQYLQQRVSGELLLQDVLLGAKNHKLITHAEIMTIRAKLHAGETSEYEQTNEVLARFKTAGINPGFALHSMGETPHGKRPSVDERPLHPYATETNLTPRFHGGGLDPLPASVRSRPLHTMPHDELAGGGPADDLAALEREMRMEQQMALEALGAVSGERDTRQQHRLKLRSVYDNYGWDGEPSLTCADSSFLGTCDYILYSVEKLKPQTILSTPDLDTIVNEDPRELEMSIDETSSVDPPKGFTGNWVRPLKENDAKRHSYLPNAEFPSNHVALMTEFSFQLSFLESLWSEGSSIAPDIAPEEPPDPPDPSAVLLFAPRSPREESSVIPGELEAEAEPPDSEKP